MLFSTAMYPLPRRHGHLLSHVMLVLMTVVPLHGCKRREPPPDPLKSQRDSMERAKEVGQTMQKAVDREGSKADEESR